MAFDPQKFTQAFQAKLATGKPMNENAAWLMRGSSGYDIGSVLQNFNQLDPSIQQQILATDVGGGAGGAFQAILQAQQNGLDPSLIQQAVQGMSSGQNQNQIIQNLQQQNAQQSQLNSQNQQLSAFNKQYQGQMFGADAQGNPSSMTDSLTNNTGTIGALNKFETDQTAKTFNQLLSPQIQMALGGQGLQDSGASVELNSKALAQLQMAQQQNIMQAALGAQSQEQGLQQQQVLGNIAGQQGMISNTLNTNNAYMTMQFQQQLMQQQADLAKQLTQYGGGSSSVLGGALQGGLSGAMTGFMAGGPWGAVAGGAIGAGMGGYSASQGQNANTAGSLGGFGGAGMSNFFANKTPTSQGVSGYGNGNPLSLGGSPSPYGG